MSSDRTLRAVMLALVLLNLVFVQLTGVAGLHWLIPLYAFTLGAPLFERQRERFVYRLLWNGGVVCFFFVLLRHVLSADLAYVREDGLVLAALCQVHLLNNLRTGQRPDLLFFNAFLIAIFAGFMSRGQGLGFPVAFFAFVPCFVVGLQLLSATRDGHVLPNDVTKRLFLDGGRRAGILVGLALLAFLFWPRDFERKAFFHGRLEVITGRPGKLEIGFNEQLRLDRSGPVQSSDREALRVTLLEGDSADVSPLWRGATLGATLGGTWQPLDSLRWREAGPADLRWRGRGGRLVRSGLSTPGGARVEVVRFEQGTERLFTTLDARTLELAAERADRLVRPRPDGTFDVAETGRVRYLLTLAPAAVRQRGGPRPDDLPPALLPYVELDQSDAVLRARDLAARLAEGLPAEAEQHELVTRLSEHLARSYTYLAPGSEGAATTLDDFLRGAAGGHCEFFASALATMLRSLEVPCRVVTGFRSTRWDAEGRVLKLRAADAHAWVEVHDPSAGWYAVDPSPVLVEQAGGAGLWARLQSGARSVWESVTDFDAERRAALFAWVRTLPGRGLSAFRERPLGAALTLALLVLPVAWIVRRRRARTQPAVRAYRRAMRRAKLRLQPGETPRELLARARGQDLPPARLHALERATREHEATRYAA